MFGSPEVSVENETRACRVVSRSREAAVLQLLLLRKCACVCVCVRVCGWLANTQLQSP